QHPCAAAVLRRAGRLLPDERHLVPEPGSRRLRAGGHRCALHLPGGQPGRAHTLAASLRAARPAHAAVEQVLGRRAATAPARPGAPAVSLEGRALALVRSAPLGLRALLWSKDWVGVLPLALLARARPFGASLILRVDTLMMVVPVATVPLVPLGVASLAPGL